jgi:hypothetical protein
LTFSILIFLAGAFLIGVVEIEAHRPAPKSSLGPLEERSNPQELPANPAAIASMSTTDRLDNHYLMLVNTAIANKMDTLKMAQFDRSPYDGLAVSFADAYDTSPVLSLTPMQAQIATWKQSTTRAVP